MADETNHMEKIGQILLDLSGEAAFSAEAMSQFLTLKDEVASLEATNDYLRRNNKEKDEALKEAERAGKILMSDKNGLAEELAHFHDRMSQLQDREMQCSINEVKMECATARVTDHQSMVGLIFRNTELRKTFIGQEMHYQPGCVEIRDEFGNVKQYAEQAGFVGVPVKKDEVEKAE